MEIKPQELRLTNLIEWNKEACTVQSIRGNDIGLYDRNKALICTTTKLIKPIELTPEWLERFGFKLKDPHSAVRILDLTGNGTTLQNWINTGKISICRSGMNAKSCPCEYVHQLQNLYFALTGEELAIDKTSLI